MSPTRDHSMHLIPGSALGPFTLGDSLWKVLEELRAGGENESGVTVRWDREDPSSPVIVEDPPGISLVFPQTGAPHLQLLQLIVLRLGPATETTSSRTSSSEGGISIEFAGKHLTTVTLSGGPTTTLLSRGQVTQRFGPSFTRRTDTTSGGSSSSRTSPTNGRESEIKYPGVIFSLDPTEGEVVQAITLVPHGTEDSTDMQRFMDRLWNGGKGTWGRWNDVGGDLEGTIMSCEINPRKGITLHISNRSGITPYVVTIGETTSQDLLADLGAPARRYWKEDGRSLGGEAGSAVDEDAGGKGCWWNYFELGLDFLIDEQSEGKVVKIMVHSNIPGTAEFQRYARCPWTIALDGGTGVLTLQGTIQEFAAAFGRSDIPSSGKIVGKGLPVQRVIQLDRLEEPHMAGVRGIEPSQLLALENMIVEGGATGITSVLLF